ncbi:hypothetical protein GH733_015617 [Mirounga leonina]|nr:hypothetical protein GH733_015617 [Mirounga leonina]
MMLSELLFRSTGAEEPGPLVALVQGLYSTKKHRVVAESSNPGGARPTANVNAASSELGDFSPGVLSPHNPHLGKTGPKPREVRDCSVSNQTRSEESSIHTEGRDACMGPAGASTHDLGPCMMPPQQVLSWPPLHRGGGCAVDRIPWPMEDCGSVQGFRPPGLGLATSPDPTLPGTLHRSAEEKILCVTGATKGRADLKIQEASMTLARMSQHLQREDTGPLTCELLLALNNWMPLVPGPQSPLIPDLSTPAPHLPFRAHPLRKTPPQSLKQPSHSSCPVPWGPFHRERDNKGNPMDLRTPESTGRG